MKLLLKREPSTAKSTTGKLYLDGNFECYILEDVVREVKIPGETAIPEGTYQVVITHSPRFKKFLPLLVDVPGFTGVRIHCGNRPEDTEGCLLPGRVRDPKGDGVLESKPAFTALFAKLSAATKAGDVISLEILPAAAKPVQEKSHAAGA